MRVSTEMDFRVHYWDPIENRVKVRYETTSSRHGHIRTC